MATTVLKQQCMHRTYREIAEQHQLAANSHRTAAERHEKGDLTGSEQHALRALDYSNRAYELAKEAHNKSGRIGSL